MILIVDRTEGRLRVESGEDLKRLSAAFAGSGHLEKPLPTGLRLDEDGSHLWVEIATLSTLAGAGRPCEWHRQFDAMIVFAARHGWVDDKRQAVRIHIGGPKV